MTTSLVMPETHPELEQPKSDWCYFLIEHLDEFARLAWYLVADTALVECVMVRAMGRLEALPFSSSNALLTYNHARDTVIGEAIAVLNLPQHGFVEPDESPIGPVGLCERPDLPRLAFLLKLILQMPQSEVARLLKAPVALMSELIDVTIFRLGHRVPAFNEGHNATKLF